MAIFAILLTATILAWYLFNIISPILRFLFQCLIYVLDFFERLTWPKKNRQLGDYLTGKSPNAFDDEVDEEDPAYFA